MLLCWHSIVCALYQLSRRSVFLSFGINREILSKSFLLHTSAVNDDIEHGEWIRVVHDRFCRLMLEAAFFQNMCIDSHYAHGRFFHVELQWISATAKLVSAIVSRWRNYCV